MTYENINLAINEGIATVTINRPKVLNALNAAVIRELSQAFDSVKNNTREIKAVMITGSGDKAFVAGADIAAMKAMTALDAEAFVKDGHDCMKKIENCPVPVIAAVNGFALGGGLELALSCDFIYASRAAKLGLPEVNLGLFPGFGGTQRLARLLGRNRAKEFIFSADMVTADEACALGIVNRVFEPDQLISETVKQLQKITSKGPIAVRLAKKVINEGTDLSLASGLAFEEAQFPIIFATDDRMEGVTAFLEKRRPNFTGK
ncbi:MAG: enoyl-CoA hydratase/isomerase family protein [Deltaproteobacteria bacterium]|nr:enoyl-CoA hydratase/isomerase family protein [Deltaproteobacteria bacterium]